MGNGMLIMQGMRGMFTWIPGNLLDDSAECYHLNIPRNVIISTFRGMFERIPGNVW